jgi:hypothetical protein
MLQAEQGVYVVDFCTIMGLASLKSKTRNTKEFKKFNQEIEV